MLCRVALGVTRPQAEAVLRYRAVGDGAAQGLAGLALLLHVSAPAAARTSKLLHLPALTCSCER